MLQQNQFTHQSWKVSISILSNEQSLNSSKRIPESGIHTIPLPFPTQTVPKNPSASGRIQNSPGRSRAWIELSSRPKAEQFSPCLSEPLPQLPFSFLGPCWYPWWWTPPAAWGGTGCWRGDASRCSHQLQQLQNEQGENFLWKKRTMDQKETARGVLFIKLNYLGHDPHWSGTGFT